MQYWAHQFRLAALLPRKSFWHQWFTIMEWDDIEIRIVVVDLLKCNMEKGDMFWTF